MRVEKMRVQWRGGQQALWMGTMGCKKGRTDRKRSRGKGQFELRFIFYFFLACVMQSLSFAIFHRSVSSWTYFCIRRSPSSTYQSSAWSTWLSLPSRFHPTSVAYSFWPCRSLLRPRPKSVVLRPRAGLRWGPVTVRAELLALKTGWSSRSRRSFQNA